MSVQETKTITRKQAEEKAFTVWTERKKIEAMSYFKMMADKELEDYIEEKFYNYKIVSVIKNIYK